MTHAILYAYHWGTLFFCKTIPDWVKHASVIRVIGLPHLQLVLDSFPPLRL